MSKPSFLKTESKLMTVCIKASYNSMCSEQNDYKSMSLACFCKCFLKFNFISFLFSKLIFRVFSISFLFL